MLKKNILFSLGLLGLLELLILFTPLKTYGDFKSDLAPAYQLYMNGSFDQALVSLNQITAKTPNDRSLIAYWKGVCESRLGHYEKAISHFNDAESAGAAPEGATPGTTLPGITIPGITIIEEFHYELGQAQYAAGQLKAARDSFQKSVNKKFKLAASLYYVAFINQLLEEYIKAHAFYERLIQLPGDPDRVEQAALYQIAEIKIVAAEAFGDKTQQTEQINERVFPALRAVISFNNDTPIAAEAKQRMAQLQAQFDRNLKKTWMIRASQEIKFDTNVIFRANDSILAVSNTASFLSATSLYARYEKILSDSFAIAPDLQLSKTRHLNRDVPYVYQNDNFSSTIALRSRLDHSYQSKPASLGFNIEYNLYLRDWEMKNELPYFSRYFNFTLSERVPFFDFGSTIFTGNFKLYANADDNQNAIYPALTITQNFRIEPFGGYSISLSYGYNRARNLFYDRADYRITQALNYPKAFAGLDAIVALDFTYVDTVNQRIARGYEQTISPSLILGRELGKHFYLNFSYNFTDNISKDTINYAYSKHVIGASLSSQF